jgi:double zinc ribbon protein
MSRILERFGQYLAVAVLVAAVIVGVVVNPGTGVLVVVGALLVAVLLVGYSAVDALLASDENAPPAELREGEVATLRREKASLLQVLRDLEVERDLGKVSAHDFENLDRQFRDRAIDVMKRIDRDLAGYRRKAEELIAERMAARERVEAAEAARGATASPAPAPVSTGSCPSCQTPIDTETIFCRKCGRRVSCASCSAVLDADAVFCKRCGTKVESHA